MYASFIPTWGHPKTLGIPGRNEEDSEEINPYGGKRFPLVEKIIPNGVQISPGGNGFPCAGRASAPMSAGAGAESLGGGDAGGAHGGDAR